MADNINFLTNETQVNRVDPLSATNGVDGNQFNAEVTALANGHFVVVYDNAFNGNNADSDIMAQEYDENGVAIGAGPFRVNFDAGETTAPDVAQVNSGGYITVFQDVNNGQQISMVKVVPGVTASNPAEVQVVDFAETVSAPTIATFANGAHIVGYQRATNGGDVGFAIVDADGTAVTVAGTSLSTDAAAQFGPRAAAGFSGGNSVVVWNDDAGAGAGSTDIMMREINSAGADTGAGGNVVVANTSDDLGNADIDALSDGRYIITWDNLTSHDISGRIYNPFDNTLSSVFSITNDVGIQTGSRVGGLSDGGFIATWTDASGDKLGDVLGNTLVGRRYNANGVAVGDEFRVNQGTTGNQSDGAIASNQAGQVFTAWTDTGHDLSTDASGTGVQGRALTAVTDVVNGTVGSDLIQTYDLSETINGAGGDDQVFAAGGDDNVNGGTGNDILLGEEGNDSLGGNDGNDVLVGGNGNDIIGGDEGNDSLSGDAGNDTLFGGNGNDAMSGGTGDDIMVGNDGADLMDGGADNDNMNGGTGSDILIGGTGNDSVGGGADNDVVVGNEGNDFLFGEDGADQMAGGDGDDVVVGGSGDDVMGGGIGNDTMVGDDGNDGIFGEDGNDNINAGAGNDVVLGGNGNDQIGGGAGDDSLRGEADNDVIFGEDGNDFITGGTGNDTIISGSGNDVFVFTAGDGADVITDFVAGGTDDLILLQSTSLTSFAQVLAATTIVGGAAVITYNGANTITLNGVTSVAQLTASDFAFL